MEDWSNTVIGAVVAAIGAFGLWVANRMLGKAAFQTAINAGFKELLDQLQEERRVLMAELSAERTANSTERTQMRGEIRNLRQVVESLKNVLRSNGIPVPEVNHLTPGAEEVHVLDGTPGYPHVKERN
jgi:hypothetical protein